MGPDAVFVGQHATCGSDGAGKGSDLANARFSCRDQPALSCSVDRLDPTDHAGRVGAGVRISLERSCLLHGRHNDRSLRRVGA